MQGFLDNPLIIAAIVGAIVISAGAAWFAWRSTRKPRSLEDIAGKVERETRPAFVSMVRRWAASKKPPFPPEYYESYETTLRRRVEQRIADGSLQRDIQRDLDRLLPNKHALPGGRLPPLPLYGHCSCGAPLEYSEVARLVMCPTCPPSSPLPHGHIRGEFD